MNSDNTINVIYYDIFSGMSYELNIPLYISGSEFTEALLSIYAQAELQDKDNYQVISDSPVIVVCGNRSIKSFGLRNGSVVSLRKNNIRAV